MNQGKFVFSNLYHLFPILVSIVVPSDIREIIKQGISVAGNSSYVWHSVSSLIVKVYLILLFV